MHGACNGLTRMLTRTSSAAVPRAEAQAASVPSPAEVAGIAPSAGRRVVRPPLRGTQDDLGVVGVHHDLLELVPATAPLVDQPQLDGELQSLFHTGCL